MARSFPHCLAISFSDLIKHLPVEFIRVPTQDFRADGLGLPFAALGVPRGT
jgi:hypothetical protein